MARQTRSQRRARRAAQAQSAATTQSNGVVERARARQAAEAAVAAPAAEPSREEEGVREAPRRRGTGRFVSESWGELKKVEWPGQNQVIQGTVVVLVAVLIVGLFLYASDQVFKRLVEDFFL